MNLLEYYEGLYKAKKACEPEPCEPEPKNRGKYVVSSRKKKGAGKGYKETIKFVDNCARNRRGELRAIEVNNPSLYGLELIKALELCCFDSAREFNAEIARIRKRYGLDYQTVKNYFA
jgi:hypothetical protein